MADFYPRRASAPDRRTAAAESNRMNVAANVVLSPTGNFMNESFAELFEQSQSLNKLRPGSIVSGIVVDIRSDVVVINAGLKSEGIVPIEQFREEDGTLEINIGDEVKVALDAIEDGFGETKLSREKAKRALVWDELEGAFEKSRSEEHTSELQ